MKAVAALWLVVVGGLAVVMLPGLVGGFVDHLGFSEQGAGFVAAAQIFGGAFGLVISALGMTRLNLRTAAVCALVAILACELLSAKLANEASVLPIARFAAGLGAGAVLGLGVGIISAMRNPDAKFGLALVALFGMGGAGLYLLPGLLGSIGMEGVFLSFAGVCSLGLVITPWIPSKTGAGRAAEEEAGSLGELMTGAVMLVLLACSFFYFSNGAQWTYLDRIGVGAGLAIEQVGTALSISMLFGILGALAAAALAGRVSRQLCLFTGTSAAVIASIMLTLDLGMVSYCIAASLVNFGLSFVLPFYLGILANVDPTGRIGSVAFVLNFLAMSLGPAAGALMIGGGFDRLLFVTAGVYVASFVMVSYANRQLAPLLEPS